ncbi:Protein of unknown function DUF1749 [Penicillium brevicompactum]|uniref:Protein of unknown function DUF1749 n=1 Tax=Penicillium brevicompactum TaxID=5074 RepID=UPI002540C39D|nr:Protein of unknown function DUF1749 [Penicillium brevicompactum]KAJ5348382.1 Protein of unknown function DUF1749 [Penicillium brevicompactum]
MELKLLASMARGQPGILHHCTDTLVAFEYTRSHVPKPHTLIFVGGLGDSLGSVDYLNDVIRALDPTQWSVFSLILSCAGGGWGMGRLGKDIDELSQCVSYVRDYKTPQFGTGKVVIMGHSTGSQDVMHYINCPNPRPAHPVFDRNWKPIVRVPVDGAIMQAPVSDREGILWVVKCGTARDSPAKMRAIYNKAVADARRATYDDHDSVDTVVPLSVTSRIGYPPSAPLLVLYSGRDQSVPPWVNKEALLKRWQTAADGDGRQIWDTRSMVIPNASHALSDSDQAEPRRILVERVTAYLNDIQRG